MSRLLNKKANLIRLIHIAKQQVGRSEGEYRTMLAIVSQGKATSTPRGR